MHPAEPAKPPVLPPQPQIVHSSPPVQQTSRHLSLPLNPSPTVQLVISAPPPPPPPPPAKDPLTRNSGQMLSNVFNQLLHSEQESTIASLLSSSDGQSMGTPASMEPLHHPRSPPLSVPSNCSYPATPGMNSSNLSVNNANTSGSAGPVPTSTNTDPSPINAIFDTAAAADLSDGRGESNPAPAPPPPPPLPRGLAAYLQKSRHPAEAVASPSEEGIDDYARQHGSVPPMSSSASSPWTAERRGGIHTSGTSNTGAGIYPTSSSSLTSTPNGQEAGSKEKRGLVSFKSLVGLIKSYCSGKAPVTKTNIFS